MILPDHEIKNYLAEGKLVVEPLDNPDAQVQPAWIDLRLGNEFKVFKHTKEPFIDSKQPKEYTEPVQIADRGFTVHPGEFILGITKERIKIPAELAAYVDGQSSLGRLGVTTHITAGWVDPGFDGRLVLEISNLGKMPVILYPNGRIAKLVLFKLSSPAQVPYNLRKDAKYRNQDGVAQSKIYKDNDLVSE